MADKPRLRVPSEAKKGEVIQIKSLVAHPMETGFRKDESGKIIPREIINTFVCTFNGREVFRADLEPAIAANRAALAFHPITRKSFLARTSACGYLTAQMLLRV